MWPKMWIWDSRSRASLLWWLWDYLCQLSGRRGFQARRIMLSIPFGNIFRYNHHKVTSLFFDPRKYIVFCAETVIFLLAGMLVGIDVISASGVKHLDTSDYYKILGLYGCMLVVRFSAIALFMPILRKIAYGLTWVEVFPLFFHE